MSQNVTPTDPWYQGEASSIIPTFFFAIFFIASFILGIAGNSLVIYAFLSKKELRSHTNIFFINLSISDILVILVCVPVALTDLFLPDNWYYGYIYCKLYFFVEYFVTSVSSLTIIIISLERYVATSKPFYVKQIFDGTNSRLLTLVLWLIGFVASCPLIFMTDYPDTSHAECMLVLNPENLVYLFILNAVFIFIPCVSLFFVYICIILNLKRNSTLITGNQIVYRPSRSASRSNKTKNTSIEMESHQIESAIQIVRRQNSKNSEHERNVGLQSKMISESSVSRYKGSKKVHVQTTRNIMVLLLVTLLFYCCLLPLRIFLLWAYVNNFLETMVKDINLINAIANTVKVIYFLHCISNPIVYNILSTKFRKAFFGKSIQSNQQSRHYSINSNRF